MFRFVILGAAKIAPKFVEAVRLSGESIVTAVGSKSAERAASFAAANNLERWYDDYGRMLDEEKPDAAYIATTPDSHFPLTMLCLSKGVPVLCEKAMFLNREEAEKAFGYAKEKNLFLMEAMWSRFLPATQQLKSWLAEGKIGHVEVIRTQIGFHVPEGDENRYRNKALGGGAARDILVYAYEQTDYVLEGENRKIHSSAIWGPTGVDMTDQVTLLYEKEGRETLADLTVSFEVPMNDEMVLYGEKGKIVMPNPHYPSEVMVYDHHGNLTDHYKDEETVNGFVYEVREVIRCITEGKDHSDIETPETTIACAALFDLLEKE